MKLKNTLPIALLLLIVSFLNSCSTSEQANRYSHLKYVKKDVSVSSSIHENLLQTSPEKLETKAPELIGKPAIDQPALYAAKATEKESAKQNEYSPKSSTTRNIHNSSIDKPSFENNVGQAGSSVKNNFKKMEKLVSPDLMHDQNKLLLLWLILLGAAVVIWVLAIYAWPLAIIGTLAFIASVVFFVLWLISFAS